MVTTEGAATEGLIDEDVVLIGRLAELEVESTCELLEV